MLRSAGFMLDPPSFCKQASTHALHIAVLEDNWELRQEILLPALHEYGFHAHGAATAAELYRMMLTRHFDMLVLDSGLPDEDGFTVARHLRGMSADLGIVMLSNREGRQQHLHALQSGADFFLAKPVDLELLAAILHNLGRRLMRHAPSDATAVDASSASWRLEGGGWRLVSPQEKRVALTHLEQCLVAVLAAGEGHPVTREALIRAIAHDDHHFDPHRLEMIVHRLRRRVLQQTGEPLPLLTVRGSGYRLTIGG